VKDFLENDGLAVLAAHSGAEGLAICSRQRVDAVLLDQRLPDGEGHTLAPAILEQNDQTKIIFITAYPSFENAVKAVRSGAHDYLSKPFDLEELRLTVENALRTLDLEKVEQVHSYEREREREGLVLVGGAGGLAGVARLVESAAQSDAPVLITGETGTGKNLAAKAIHYKSPVPRSVFISINCAALPESLIEAELFGHEKGAFTGAVAAKKGVFEMADGGTLFLDEIGEMPLHLQSKLLSVIEDRSVRRIGGTAVKPVNVRIIAATNSDLERSLGKTFRKDLYYRLSVVRVHLPPLRERREDIPALCAYLLAQVSGGRSVHLPDDEIAKLREYDWPGNVRELRNVLERALLVQKGPALHPSLLLEKPAAGNLGVLSQACGSGVKTLEEAEKELICSARAQLGGNLTRAAKALGISLSTLKRKIKEYGL
jgi:DNA-binding NtrC family response regulator